MSLTVADILKARLVELGADGLCNPDEACGCGIEALAPCDCVNLQECQAAKWISPKPGEPGYQDEWPEGYFEVLPESQA